MKLKKIIYFDGVCNLCNWTVKFIIKHDKKNVFMFAPLQSDFMKSGVTHANGQYIKKDSVIYQKGDQVFSRSDAILHILKTLGGGWKLLYAFKIIPKPWRNWLYDRIAKNRYRWFGKKDRCMLPSPEIQSRFLS